MPSTVLAPSRLRLSTAAFPQFTLPITTRPQTTFAPPAKKQKMSLRQTYFLANVARGKMTREASRGDHDLRLLVGHANFLDSLILDLANAEQEQEMWFNHSVRGAVTASDEPKRVQWADRVPEEAIEEDEEDEDSPTEFSGNESESDDDDVDAPPMVSLRHQQRPRSPVTTSKVGDAMILDGDYEDGLALTRTASHPPDLMHESDSDSDDDMMPPSPPQAELSLDVFSEKQRAAIVTTSFYQSIPETSDTAVASLPPSEQASFFDEGFYLPQRQPHATMVQTF